jgi:hypothetical protein
LKASDEEKTLVGNDFIDILKSDSDFITQILWELKSTDVKIMESPGQENSCGARKWQTYRVG